MFDLVKRLDFAKALAGYENEAETTQPLGGSDVVVEAEAEAAGNAAEETWLSMQEGVR